ncbi:MAG: aminoglycoside 6-adenylyltransferase [Caldilinea sp.]|nr:aminoglycoside 6-adenylyltransferase [Caldilinea sp.]
MNGPGEHSQYQDATVAMLIDWGSAHSLVRAILLTSTRAIPNAPVDILSDYDVILVVQDIQPFVLDRTWLNDFGEILVVYWDPIHSNTTFGIDQCGNVTQYASGLKIDFTLWPVELFQQIVAAPVLDAELDAGYRVLLDKDRLTDAMPAPTYTAYTPKPPSSEAYLSIINDFLSSAPYVAKCLWRDDLFPARWCLEADMRHPFLRQMLEWRIQIEHGWSIPIGNLGKGLKKHLAPELWAEVEQTFTGADIADNWAALINMMALFRRVAREVGDHFGYVYPEELHQRVCAYVQEIQRLERPQAKPLRQQQP